MHRCEEIPLDGIWLYGKEGNALYVTLVRPLRAPTTRLPRPMLVAIGWALTVVLSRYVAACRVFPLPLRRYMRAVMAELSASKRYLVVYDQLNPAHAKHHTREEARALLSTAGFVDVSVYHRHGYSWTVIGRKQDPGEHDRIRDRGC